ncbi:phosphoribosylaminoimidazole carboxylase ATPase subunit [Klebsiella pneumoniae]|uniref:Phosphoribosylaminoimidazole carboxylase ATPase subunit n=1 Tax=Klebsiella pneumoniae TaxID=573 RepID=A0A4P0XZW0_KLEPN|nr:phosphoribosylaminoimidazole carboxylase ATPase subunit [Klebsiella pneumoniae]
MVNSPSVMINLIGTDLNYDWLKLPLVHLHWYDKEVRPGRKVGHLNLTDSDTDRLSATLESDQAAAAAGVHQRPVLGAIAAQLSPSCRGFDLSPSPAHLEARTIPPLPVKLISVLTSEDTP